MSAAPATAFYTTQIAVLWLLPLVGAIVLWAFGPQLQRRGGWVGSAFVFASFAIALSLFGGASNATGLRQPLVTWVPGFSFGLQLDALSLLWTLVITGVGGLIHIYSIGYMWSDRAIARFFAYLNFFVFSMLTLVLADDVVGLLVGWGLVGLASYFLIGFWFYKPTAVAAARKAFVINVFGDLGIMFAVFAMFAASGSIVYADIFAKAGTFSEPAILAICVGLFIGAMAKSAQVPLHTWLPDAMEGPTPVSALIHAATMVTAGVYLIARFAPIWNLSPTAQEMVAVVGALTMLWGAILGVVQWDIKRILAYSTMSQIGYMIMGVGVGAYQAGVLHFFTHAFFKAQLFLGAGLIIHALADEQDVRKMGGLYKRMPFAFYAMLLGTLAISGFPLLSGYFSKDAVIYGALEHGHPILFGIGALTAGLTAYYMFRMIFLTFFGAYRGGLADIELGIGPTESAAQAAHSETHGHDHAPAWLMQVPVAILMIPTVVAGYVLVGGERSAWYRYFGTLFGRGENVAGPIPAISEFGSTVLVLVLVALGIVVAYLRYGAPKAQLAAVDRVRAESRRMPDALAHAFYVDDLIGIAIVRPARALGENFSRFVDPHVIDAGVRDVAFAAGALGAVFRALQNGLVRAYALTIVVGTACFIAYFALLGGAR
ncbi:MAG: NADH-quinone oxidoreductase subunit L [Vulcanimicrobiaceae bacterium]